MIYHRPYKVTVTQTKRLPVSHACMMTSTTKSFKNSAVSQMKDARGTPRRSHPKHVRSLRRSSQVPPKRLRRLAPPAMPCLNQQRSGVL